MGTCAGKLVVLLGKLDGKLVSLIGIAAGLPRKPGGGNRGIGELGKATVCGGTTGSWIEESLGTCCEVGATKEKELSDVGYGIKTPSDSSIGAGRQYAALFVAICCCAGLG